ncbi:MAG: DUF2867 domain-containing protein [Rhizobiaceae bacterium]|nr:DUF2867 domain-containing protein [Rhizobiaceae bacterium]
MTAVPVELPAESALHQFIQPGDFIDCYFNDDVEGDISVSHAAKKALMQMPRWAIILLKVRNFIVSFYGLKTGANNPAPADLNNLAVGDYIGVFQVQLLAANEILIGQDDKHLNFLISVMRYKGGVTLATWVHTHNWFGRLYLWVIMPFHKLIVRNAVSRISTG